MVGGGRGGDSRSRRLLHAILQGGKVQYVHIAFLVRDFQVLTLLPLNFLSILMGVDGLWWVVTSSGGRLQ